MSENRIFVDTNILVYAYDLSAGAKHDTAQYILSELWNSGRGLLSTQVLQEFFVAITGKVTKPLDWRKAANIVEDLLSWDLVVNDGASILQAAAIQARYRVSFWDALILHAALRGGAQILLSEDFSSGTFIEGLLIKNPFNE